MRSFKIVRRFKDWSKRFWRAVVYYASGLYNRADSDHVFLMSGGLAFSLFICAIPLSLLIMSAAGQLLEEPSVRDQIEAYIDRIIPYANYAAQVKAIVFRRIGEFSVYKTVAGILGVFGMFFAASGLFGSIRTILHQVYRVDDTSTILRSKLVDIGHVLLTLLYFLISMALLPVLDVIVNVASRADVFGLLDIQLIDQIIVKISSFAVLVAVYALMYYSLPSQKPPRAIVSVSALTAAVLWVLAQQLFGWYLSEAVFLRRIYGAYVFIIVVAFWVYYSSLVFIVGAEIGQLYRERASGTP